MKRINTTTGTHFRRGDVRQDGMVFFAYTNRKRRDGHFVEIWLRPEASDRAMARDRLRHKKRTNGDSLGHAGTNP